MAPVVLITAPVLELEALKVTAPPLVVVPVFVLPSLNVVFPVFVTTSLLLLPELKVIFATEIGILIMALLFTMTDETIAGSPPFKVEMELLMFTELAADGTSPV